MMSGGRLLKQAALCEGNAQRGLCSVHTPGLMGMTVSLIGMSAREALCLRPLSVPLPPLPPLPPRLSLLSLPPPLPPLLSLKSLLSRPSLLSLLSLPSLMSPLLSLPLLPLSSLPVPHASVLLSPLLSLPLLNCLLEPPAAALLIALPAGLASLSLAGGVSSLLLLDVSLSRICPRIERRSMFIASVSEISASMSRPTSEASLDPAWTMKRGAPEARMVLNMHLMLPGILAERMVTEPAQTWPVPDAGRRHCMMTDDSTCM